MGADSDGESNGIDRDEIEDICIQEIGRPMEGTSSDEHVSELRKVHT